jgi:hypothetical protein
VNLGRLNYFKKRVKRGISFRKSGNDKIKFPPFV